VDTSDQNIENNCQLLVAFVTWLTGQDVCVVYQLDRKISKTNCLASIWPQKQKLMVKSYKWPASIHSMEQPSPSLDCFVSLTQNKHYSIIAPSLYAIIYDYLTFPLLAHLKNVARSVCK